MEQREYNLDDKVRISLNPMAVGYKKYNGRVGVVVEKTYLLPDVISYSVYVDGTRRYNYGMNSEIIGVSSIACNLTSECPEPILTTE